MEKEQLLNSLANHSVWQGFPRGRLIPLVESGEIVIVNAGTTLFEQYHPAKQFFLLGEGCLSHSGMAAKRGAQIPFGPISAPLAAIGWSGFLQTQRFGTTVTADTDSLLVAWSQDRLRRLFYADPELSVRLFRLILHSVCNQFYDLRRNRQRDKSVVAPPPMLNTTKIATPPLTASDCLRQSAFFGRFPDQPLDQLAESARPEYFPGGSKLAKQDGDLDGPMVLVSGSCHVLFEKQGPDKTAHYHPFSRFRESIGIVAGIPTIEGGYKAEASVYATSGCWVYHIPAASIEALLKYDPEFGRTFLQRLLARVAGLIGAARITPHLDVSDPELETIADLIANSQTRLPVTSAIHQIPHLLGNKLTIGTANSQLEIAVPMVAQG
ncbi:MAG: hypothetical protein AAF438_19175, partial [Pseudomonadota bacterium]